MDKNLHSLEQHLTSWTDDVPTCKYSGVGSCWNEVYIKDGRRAQMHEFEDRSFRFHQEEYNLCLYGVFDGFHGSHVADYITKRLPAELVLGQIVPDIKDDQVKELIKQVFVSIDRIFRIHWRTACCENGDEVRYCLSTDAGTKDKIGRNRTVC